MAKEDFILSEGVVVEALANANFRVEVAGQPDLILCHLSGKMRKHFIKVLPGDRVIFEMSPYDLSKGRITRRLKPGEGLNQDGTHGAQDQAAPAEPVPAPEATKSSETTDAEASTETSTEESTNAS